MFSDKTQFPPLPFGGPHTKPHSVRGLINNYHMLFDPKLGLGTCSIRKMHCACVECMPIIDKKWVHGFPPSQQTGYQPLTECTYWPVLGSFNNWNSTTLSHKTTTSEDFEKMNQFLLDLIIDDMA